MNISILEFNFYTICLGIITIALLRKHLLKNAFLFLFIIGIVVFQFISPVVSLVRNEYYGFAVDNPESLLLLFILYLAVFLIVFSITYRATIKSVSINIFTTEITIKNLRSSYKVSDYEHALKLNRRLQVK